MAVDLNVEPDNDGHDGDYNLEDDFEEEELEDAEKDETDGQDIIDEIGIIPLKFLKKYEC